MTTCARGEVADPNAAMAAVARDVLDPGLRPRHPRRTAVPQRWNGPGHGKPRTVPPPPFAEAQQVNITPTVNATVLSDDGRRMDVPRSAVTAADRR